MHSYQNYGIVIAVIFSLCLITDGKSTKSNSSTSILLGDLLALSSSPVYALYYVINGKNVKMLPSMVVFSIVNFLNLIVFIPGVLAYDGFDYSLFFSQNEKYGAFGWYSDRYFYLSVFVLAPIGGLLGSASYTYVLAYFPPDITGNLFLLEPVIAQIMGVMFG